MKKKEEVYSFPQQKDGAVVETDIRMIPLEELQDFEGHPFKVENDMALFELMLSIEKEGVIVPALASSDKDRQPQDRIESLAAKMMELFPSGKKQGTSQYYRGNRKDITLRLKKFFKLYGNRFTDKQILEATDKYVKAFNGNYSYMRVLKYFIWKDEKKLDSEGIGYISEVSDLASYIENESGVSVDTDWTSSLK